MNKEQLISIATSKTAVGVYSALVGGAAGAYGGFFFTKRAAVKAAKETFAVELEETKKFYDQYYSRIHKGPGYSSPQEAAETLGVVEEVTEEVTFQTRTADLLTGAVDAMVNYAGVTARQDAGDGDLTAKQFEFIKMRTAPVEEVVEVVERNIFKDGVPIDEVDEDLEEPLSDEELFEADLAVARDAGTGPYVISFEEFMQAEPGYPQPNMTYFAEDDILLDDREEIITDIDGTVGAESLMRFGYKSRNKDIVYVRNPVIELDFEITKSGGSYASEVAGFKHSSDRRPMRKFRRGDDE